VGRNAVRAYAGLELGSSIRFGGGSWSVVGLFDAGGSAFDSEVWCDAGVLEEVYQRSKGDFQSVTARLTSPEAFEGFRQALSSDPRITLQIDRGPNTTRRSPGSSRN
jgi:putative ABC transport system permease protein